jgi:hypothetical protein
MLADQVRALTTTAAAAQKPAPQPDVPKQGQQLEDEKAELYLTIARLKSRLAAKTFAPCY